MRGYSKKLISLALSVALLMPMGVQGSLAVYAAEEGSVSGRVYEYDFGKSETSGTAKSGASIIITLKEGTETVESESDGSFSFAVPDDKKTDDGKYGYKIDATDEALPSEGELKDGEDVDIYIQKRYEATAADFTLPEQDGVENGTISGAGTYTIEGAGGKKLSKTLDGAAESSISVSIDADGKIEPFYVYPDDTCSKVFEDGTVPVDKDGPVIQSVETTPGDGKTYVKTHGIYGKQKAELIINAAIRDDGAGLEEVYLLGKKDGVETRYEASKVAGSDGKYTASIGLPTEETLLEAETMYLVAVDKFGNKAEKLIAKSEQGSQVTLEQVPPVIEYVVTPPENENGWYNELPTITAKAIDVNSGLESLKIYQKETLLKELNITNEREQGQKTISAQPKITSPSADGKYTFRIEAKDNAGNVAEEEFTLKIDLDAPKIHFEGVEEDGNYKEKPAVKIVTDERYPKEEGSFITAEIRKNGKKQGETLTFKQAGEVTLSKDLFKTDGEYLIIANASDAAGNVAAEEHIGFIYDATKPMLSMAPTTQPNANGWFGTLPTISVSTSDATAGLDTLKIKEDGEEIYNKAYEGRVRKIQTAEAKSFIDEPSKDGSYTFTSTAIDRAGNKTEKSQTLKIDLVAPVLSTSGVTSGTHYSSAPNIRISEEEKYYNAPGAYIRYVITRDGKKVADKRLNKTREASIPKSYLSTDGNYKVVISAKDAAGHEAKTLTYTFVKDGTAPVISLTGAENGRFYSSPRRITLTVEERFFNTNTVRVSAVRNLNGNHNVGFPWSNTGTTSSSSKTFSETGTYTITANATDKAGNRASGRSLTFTVDTVAPVISISGVEDGRVYKYGEAVAPSVKVSDDYLASQSVVYTKGGEVIQNPNFDSLKENDGTYTMVVTATDKAGNSSRKELSFVINRFGSYFEYPAETKAVMGKAMQNITGDVSIKEHNVSKLEKSDKIITRDGKKIESVAKTSEKLGAKENVYTHTFDKSNFEEEGAYEINVSSKDEAGNEMESKEENGPIVFYIDRTAPTISLTGIDPKGNKGETATLTVSAQDLLTGVKSITATVDGEEVALSENEDKTFSLTLNSGLRQEIKIAAEDGAGNREEITERASVSSNSLSLFLDRYIIPVLAAIGAALIALLLFFLGKRKKKDNEENA